MEIDQVAYPSENTNLSIERKRRDLLPIWMKIFCWIFMIAGLFAPLGLVAGSFGLNFDLAFYGLETQQPLSLLGLGITTIFLVKGFAAYGLWTGKQWAIRVSELDAITGIIICCFVMLVLPFIDASSAFKLDFRLELLLLIPYLIQVKKVDRYWDEPGLKTISKGLASEI